MHATFIRAAYLPLWGIYRVVRCALVFGLASTVFVAAFGQRLTWIGVPLGHGEARAVSADGRVIVGITWHSPARWVDGRYQPITIDPWGVSADGRIVV
ncbi:MAG: hypothetical protein NZM28_02430, partial [Fimbriimonadales bacterium]|nr:hypothetical protein [Fimbriimonadales bacterium]